MDTANRSRLQQQPRRFVDRQQQQSSGSREFQPRGAQPWPAQAPKHPARQMGDASAGHQDNIDSSGRP